MKPLCELVSANEPWLVSRVLHDARENGFTRDASDLEEAWGMSVADLSAAIVASAGRPLSSLEPSPQESSPDDPLAVFGVREARRRRERGVTMGMFLGLFKYVRRSYHDLVRRAGFEPEHAGTCGAFLDRCFDRIEIAFCTEWSGEALARSEERFRSMVQNSSDIITVIGPDGTIRYQSPSLERILGYRHEELVGRNAFDFLHPEDIPRPLKVLQDVLVNGGTSPSVEYRFRHKDGSWRSIEAIGSLFRDESGTAGVVVNCRDISDRKRAEEAIKASEEEYRSVVGNIKDVIFRTDRAGRWTFLNSAWTAMTGHAVDGSVGHPYAEFLCPEDREVAQALFDPGSRTDFCRGEVRWRTAAGGTRCAEVYARAACDASGRPAGTYGTLHDVTERKQAEEALRASEEQLRQSQKMEAVGRLAGGVAHDFNNLLTAINGYSDLLLHRLAAHDPLRREIEEIRKAGERAAELTRQLLAFSRRQVFQSRVLDLNSVVANMDKMLRRLIGEDIELSTLPAPELGSVKADPGQVEQVLVNLAVNARDAMPEGGKLAIATANVALDEAYARRRHVAVTPGPYVTISVADTGCGMDAAVQAHLFEPFFTTKEKGKGTGLGLATVYGIVRQSGGHIAVETSPGRGTTFRIYLPRVEGKPEAAALAEAPAEAPRGLETILLVEDEEVVRELVHAILKRNGYTVLAARHGGEALLLSERHQGPIHLMVTDVVMPQMNGRELAERLHPLRPGMKVLYMSGYTDDAVVRHGVLDRGTEFLQKPFTMEALARKVRDLLDGPPAGEQDQLSFHGFWENGS